MLQHGVFATETDVAAAEAGVAAAEAGIVLANTAAAAAAAAAALESGNRLVIVSANYKAQGAHRQAAKEGREDHLLGQEWERTAAVACPGVQHAAIARRWQRCPRTAAAVLGRRSNVQNAAAAADD
jgi:hypothetical protein